MSEKPQPKRADFDLGHGHVAHYTSWSPDRDLNPQYEGIPDVEKFGLIIEHPNKEHPEQKCVSGIRFASDIQRKLDALAPHAVTYATWDVESWDPLTVSPSLLCSCGDHGFIRGGRWWPV